MPTKFTENLHSSLTTHPRVSYIEHPLDLLLPVSSLCVLSAAAHKAARKTRGELAKMVDADYYGYRDEDDGIIVPLEQEREKEGELVESGAVAV